MSDFFVFGSRKITYRLSYSDRKTLGITITPDSEVLVKAPFETSKEKIEEKLNKRAAWIIKQQNFFLSFQPRATKRSYISGETHLYLGRQYQLKIIESEQESVKLIGGYLTVFSKKKEKVELLVKEWYAEHARRKFQQIANPIIEQFQAEKVTPEALIIREMSLRWGSCTPKGKIILNPELIKAPKGCIEYVIVHELCHLVHRDHSDAFFRLQTRYFPNWEKWKEKLERLMA
jgi:predicted metal-dependent hydrolase